MSYTNHSAGGGGGEGQGQKKLLALENLSRCTERDTRHLNGGRLEGSRDGPGSRELSVPARHLVRIIHAEWKTRGRKLKEGAQNCESSSVIRNSK